VKVLHGSELFDSHVEPLVNSVHSGLGFVVSGSSPTKRRDRDSYVAKIASTGTQMAALSARQEPRSMISPTAMDMAGHRRRTRDGRTAV
jgi:hypothetical protein